MSLHILLCIKQSLEPDQPLEVKSPPPGKIVGEDSGAIFQPGRADRAALEAALQLKENRGARITALSIGSRGADAALHLCLAAGADAAIQIQHEDKSEFDSWMAVRKAADTATRRGVQLILCGDASADNANGLFGPFLAEMLGWPLVTRMLEMNIDSALTSVNAIRLLERGDRQRVNCSLPAVVCANALGYEPRYISVQRMAETGKDAIEEVVSKKETPENNLRIVDVTEARPRPRRMAMPAASMSAAERMKFLMKKDQPKPAAKEKIFEGPIDAAVDQIEQYLKDNGFLNSG